MSGLCRVKGVVLVLKCVIGIIVVPADRIGVSLSIDYARIFDIHFCEDGCLGYKIGFKR